MGCPPLVTYCADCGRMGAAIGIYDSDPWWYRLLGRLPLAGARFPGRMRGFRGPLCGPCAGLPEVYTVPYVGVITASAFGEEQKP